MNCDKDDFSDFIETCEIMFIFLYVWRSRYEKQTGEITVINVEYKLCSLHNLHISQITIVANFTVI